MALQIAPNILPPLAFVGVLDVARMMIFEAIFGFIGIGIQPPTPTFGTIIADGMKYILNAWWITTVPGVLLATLYCIYIAVHCYTKPELAPTVPVEERGTVMWLVVW